MDNRSIDEQLIRARELERWADQHLPSLGDGPLQATRLTGGSSNAVFRITRGGESAVLRRPPRTPRPDSERILGREARILSALNGTKVRAPHILAWCADRDVIGVSFYVMDHVDGWGFYGDGPLPPPYDDPAADRSELAFELVRGLAELSRIDHCAVGLENFGRSENFLARQVERWLGQLASYRETEGYAGRPLPGLDYVTDWLKANIPETPRLGIIHGDYGFANTLFDKRQTGKLAAIIDWELSTIGDPLLDLGWTVYGFRPADSGGVAPPPELFDPAPFPPREDLIALYGELSGLPTDNVDYYIVLAQFKLATLLERKYAESLAGKMPRQQGEFFGRLTLNLLSCAEQIAKRSKL